MPKVANSATFRRNNDMITPAEKQTYTIRPAIGLKVATLPAHSFYAGAIVPPVYSYKVKKASRAAHTSLQLAGNCGPPVSERPPPSAAKSRYDGREKVPGQRPKLEGANPGYVAIDISSGLFRWEP